MKTLNTRTIDNIEDIRTSSSGLMARMNMNTDNESNNYDDWVRNTVLAQYDNAPKRILDVGCGLGKQTLLLQSTFPDAEVVCVDKSEQSLSVLASQADKQRTKTVCTDIDQTDIYLDGKFDLMISSYAIYYTKDLEKLLSEYKKHLSEGGKIVLLGYGSRSNNEIIDIINEVDDIGLKYYEDFINDDILLNLKSTFEIQKVSFSNNIKFQSTSDFLSWFESSEMFKKCSSELVLESVSKVIERDGFFALTKDTVGFVLS